MLNSTRIQCIISPIDMRKGIDGLCGYLASIGQNPSNGETYLFTNATHNRIKLLCFDGNGVWLCQRRLHRGRFKWASQTDLVFTLSTEQWQWLISGVDWQRCAPEIHSYSAY